MPVKKESENPLFGGKKTYYFIGELLIFFALVSACFVWYQVRLPLQPDSKKVVKFTVQKGEGGKQIASELKSQGLIKYSSFFRIYILFRGMADKLQAGDYELSPSMDVRTIAVKMADGQIMQQSATIIEGWNLNDIGQHLEDQKIVTKKDFLAAAQEDFGSQFDFLGDRPKNASLEGYIYPDTYYFPLGASAEDIIKQALQNFGAKLTPELRAEISRQNKTIFQIITMASIIEKEVQTPEDKKVVSGIFWNRLEIWKPLESCATIAYVTGENKNIYSYDDTRVKSAYNTYLNYGLPPGPISNPGMDSILAAIYPEKSDYLYFLSTPDGKTIFSKTYEQQIQAQNKYLK